MTIKIKPGDMVRHRGEIVRVMELTRVHLTLDSDYLISVGLVISQPTDLNWLNLSLTQP